VNRLPKSYAKYWGMAYFWPTLYIGYKRAISYVQSYTVVSMDVSTDMHLVVFSLVVNVEDPVFCRKPDSSHYLLPFQAQSVAAGRRQKAKSLQTQPEVIHPSCSIFIAARSHPCQLQYLHPSQKSSLPAAVSLSHPEVIPTSCSIFIPARRHLSHLQYLHPSQKSSIQLQYLHPSQKSSIPAAVSSSQPEVIHPS